LTLSATAPDTIPKKKNGDMEATQIKLTRNGESVISSICHPIVILCMNIMIEPRTEAVKTRRKFRYLNELNICFTKAELNIIFSFNPDCAIPQGGTAA
jgi:hypothetical protein